MSRFSAAALDLSRIDRSSIFPAVSFASILDARMELLQAAMADRQVPYDTGGLQSEFARIQQRPAAQREMRTEYGIQDATASVLLAFATGLHLDRLGDQHGTARQALVVEPRPYEDSPEDWESDARYRARIQLAPEAFASAGTAGGYLYWATSASPLVRDVGLAVLYPRTADVTVEVTILSAEGNGAPSDALMEAVRNALFRSDVKPLTTALTVRPAKILAYDYEAVLAFRPGPDPYLLQSLATAAIRQQADAYKRVGALIPMNALDAAAYVGGVERVLPPSSRPAAIRPLRFMAGHLSSVRLATEVLDD